MTSGRYRGNPTAIGFDRLWVSPEGHALVVEVKTTDSYRISLGTIAAYRERLGAARNVDGPSSALLVVRRGHR